MGPHSAFGANDGDRSGFDVDAEGVSSARNDEVEGVSIRPYADGWGLVARATFWWH